MPKSSWALSSAAEYTRVSPGRRSITPEGSCNARPREPHEPSNHAPIGTAAPAAGEGVSSNATGRLLPFSVSEKLRVLSRTL